MKNLNYIADEIRKGKNLEDNLAKYNTAMSSLYNGLGLMKLAMNYITVCDNSSQASETENKYFSILSDFNDILDEYVINAADTKSGLEKIEAIRNEVIGIMEVVTAYVDRFRIYEYALNRIEYRFSDEEADMEYYNTYMTNDIMHYILSDKDNVVINGKISEIVGQLPMRISKAKFFDYIKDAFTLYHGAQKQTIDDFYYALSTCAMIGIPDNFESMFPDIFDMYNTLKNADYKNIDEKEYTRLKGVLDIATQKVTDLADDFVLLAQMINDAYTVILTKDAALGETVETKNAVYIISELRNRAGKDNTLEDLYDKFEVFEGKLERLLDTVVASDFITGYAIANYEEKLSELGLSEAFDGLDAITKLQSGSDFVNLNKSKLLEDIPGNEYADSVCDKLIKELDKSFDGTQQIIKRAVQASVLSQLPVFFNNTEEIQNYVNQSLIQCNDRAEQMAVIEVIRFIVGGK